MESNEQLISETSPERIVYEECDTIDEDDSESMESDDSDADDIEGSEAALELETSGCNVIDSPCGRHKLWQSIVSNDFMSDMEKVYDTLDEALEMYDVYADKAGFDVRMNTVSRFADTREIKLRYVICHRAGKIPDRFINTLKPGGKKRHRNSTFKCTECKAHIIFERIGRTEKFKVREFKDLHNHSLFDIEDRRHSKRARKMTFADKSFIIKSSTTNLGLTKAHKLKTILEGGYENMGPEETDYKNFKRKMANLIKDYDAQLVVNKMIQREEELPNFTFELDVVDNVLNGMFWADETDKAYYKEFRDVISFDATFRSNKFGMVFVPFTAIDNHKRSVTIGAGLLSSETTESYNFLLESFLKAHKKRPRLVLSDQDTAVFKAVETVFYESRHRWCMWHIMEKLPKKVSVIVLQTTDFRKRFHDLVWDEYMECEEFERRWKSLIKEFKLRKKRWFKDMFRRRRYWLPAFFKEVPMHGLMKTTSRSESTNSFFNKFTNEAHFLVYFMMNYDTAIAKQCHNQRDAVYATKNANYGFKFPTGLEHHAVMMYTKTMFYEVQKDLYEEAWRCSLEKMETINGVQVVTITHVDKESKDMTQSEVELKMLEKDIKCTCKYFTRMGLLCRHMYRVLMNNRMEEIPEKYVLRSRRKDVISSHLLVSRHGCLETQDLKFKLISEAYNNMEICVDLVKDSKNDLLALVENTRVMVKELEEKMGKKWGKELDTELVTKMLGVRSIPDTIEIHAPKGINNKGCRTKKRMISHAEKAKTTAKKKGRKCKG